MVNSMLSYLGLSQGFWGDAMLTTCYLLNRVSNQRNRITPYELWTKRKPNLNYLRVWGCRAVVRLPDPKLKTLGERGIECIFVGYAEHSKAFRFYVIEPNESVLINSIIELSDVIFDENRLSLVPRPSLRIPNGTEDIGGSVILEEVTKEVMTQQPEPELRKSKRNRTTNDFGLEFHLYLIEGTMDEVSNPKTFDEAMKSYDVAFWKEAINDEIESIMGNNTWVLADLPPGCKPFDYKWIIKRKLKVDGTIKKFKARLVIQGFKQKSGIDYFDTYTPVAHITFLNGDLEEEVYMNQPQGFIMPGNENKAVSQLEYSRVIGCLLYAMTCIRPDIAFAIVLEGYTDASWISNTEDNLSTSGWVFLLGGGAISWASSMFPLCDSKEAKSVKLLTLNSPENGQTICDQTDHLSLKYVLGQRISTPTPMEWLPYLMGFDYEVVYKKGSKNAAADVLLRVQANGELLSMFQFTITIELSDRVVNS
ncbi:zinc finger, CCHC-type containing protein [Tanacetum coccineum]